jgi:hypothetical protein
MCEVEYFRHESYLNFKSVITPTLGVMTTMKTMMMMMMMIMMVVVVVVVTKLYLASTISAVW